MTLPFTCTAGHVNSWQTTSDGYLLSVTPTPVEGQENPDEHN